MSISLIEFAGIMKSEFQKSNKAKLFAFFAANIVRKHFWSSILISTDKTSLKQKKNVSRFEKRYQPQASHYKSGQSSIHSTKSGISKVNKNVRNKEKRLFDFNSPHGLVQRFYFDLYSCVLAVPAYEQIRRYACIQYQIRKDTSTFVHVPLLLIKTFT